jgi:hypothetical protein
MNEPKPFASLGPTLLARKGGAKPAMRPQIAPMGMGNMGGAQAARALDEDFDALEDLGWNDMGEDDAPADRSADVLQLTPAPHNAEAEAETDAGSPKALVQAEAKADAGSRKPHAVEAEAKADAGSRKPQVVEAEAKADAGSLKPHVVEAEAESDAPKLRVRSIHEELAEMLEKGETVPVAKVKPAKPVKPTLVEAAVVEIVEDKSSRRAAFTLRLDAKRHLKLRLASTVRNRSAQQLVTEALDRFLRDIPEVELLARNIQHNGRKGG